MMSPMVPAFVGRAAESRQLEDLLVEAENRSPATVMLDGEAGVGKTRLLQEFATKAEATGAFVLAGNCIPLGEGAIPYGPLTEALRLLVRQNGLPQAQKLAGPAWSKLASLIVDFTGDGEPPAGMPGSQIRVFGAVSRLLDHIGRHAPLALIFEDVHWADPSTLDLISYLTRTKSDQRMMLVCSYRSGLPPEHALRIMLAEPEFTRRTHRISLSRFTDAELRSFVLTLVTEPVSPERMERYIELSEGNPYFAEQLVTADDPASAILRVPESLNEIMLIRLAKLSGAATQVVRVAAVAGRRVSDSLLATVIEDEASLDDALWECLDQRILLVEDRIDEAYVFQHALLREAAYNTVSPRERRRLHAAMAEALTPDIDEHPRLLPELAHHWFAADRAPEALAAAVRAGALAIRMRAFQEAETQYRRALELWPGMPDAEAVAGVAREGVLRMAADAARWAGHVHRAVGWSRQAISEADPDADPARVGELYERLGSYLWEAGAVGDSVEACRQAHRLLVGRPPTAVSSRVQSALATAAVRDGQHTEALRLARCAAEEARSVGARPEEGRALNSAGLALSMLGQPDEGEALLRASLRIATEVEHLEDMLRAYGNLGVCLARSGRLAVAVDVQLAGLEKARSLGVLHTRQGGVLANNAGAVLFLLGRWDEAVALLDEVLLHRPLSETLYQRLTKAEIDLAGGRFEEADHLLDGVRRHPEHRSTVRRSAVRLLGGVGPSAGRPGGGAQGGGAWDRSRYPYGERPGSAPAVRDRSADRRRRARQTRPSPQGTGRAGHA
jgi:tetratricopeptide (TPR) repeat protein